MHTMIAPLNLGDFSFGYFLNIRGCNHLKATRIIVTMRVSRHRSSSAQYIRNGVRHEQSQALIIALRKLQPWAFLLVGSVALWRCVPEGEWIVNAKWRHPVCGDCLVVILALIIKIARSSSTNSEAPPCEFPSMTQRDRKPSHRKATHAWNPQ